MLQLHITVLVVYMYCLQLFQQQQHRYAVKASLQLLKNSSSVEAPAAQVKRVEQDAYLIPLSCGHGVQCAFNGNWKIDGDESRPEGAKRASFVLWQTIMTSSCCRRCALLFLPGASERVYFFRFSSSIDIFFSVKDVVVIYLRFRLYQQS